MFFFEQYFSTIVYYDFINVFFYQHLKQIPKLKKIVLNFGYQKANLKYIISGLLALEILSSKKSKITKSKRLNIFLKIKKGNPVGCKVMLHRRIMYSFYFKIVTTILSKFQKLQSSLKSPCINSISSISFTIKTPLSFVELENHYQLFKSLPSLNVTLLIRSKSNDELFYLSKSIKFFR